MILVVGGIASGKRTFAHGLGFPEADMAFDAHELARECDDIASLVGDLSEKAVVTCAEVGNGIVPLDADERAWRERAGRMACELAERADVVVRTVCGVPVVLKGALPRFVELVLIRHGQTPGNGERRYVGIVDQPLSATGQAEALAAGAHDEVGRVYVSKLRRTHETAALMFPKAEQVVVDGIHEMDFGDFAGRTADEMVDDAAYRAWVDSECTIQCPNGESQDEFSDRCCTALSALLCEACDRGETKLVMVAHGGTMMSFLNRYAHDSSKKYWEWLVGNCKGYRMRIAVFDDDVDVRSVELWEG